MAENSKDAKEKKADKGIPRNFLADRLEKLAEMSKKRNEVTSTQFEEMIKSNKNKNPIYKELDEVRRSLFKTRKEEVMGLFSLDFVPSYDGRISVVGEYGAGKTTLVTNLIDDVIPTERESTDGIDVHFSRLLFDIRKKTFIKSKSGLHNLPKAIYQKAFAYVKQYSFVGMAMNFSDVDEKRSTGIPMVAESSSSVVLESLHQKIKSLEDTDDIYELKFVPIPILDFAGQIIYLATHQTFITPNGIYLITIDGSKDLSNVIPSDLSVPGEQAKQTILDNIRLWISSILAYSCHTNKGYPKILFVATHKDLIEIDELEERRKLLRDAIEAAISDDEIVSHLVLDELFFVNSLDKNDPEMDKLRSCISTLITENPQWGYPVPKQFLILEMMMASLVEEGKDVLSREEVDQLNRQTGFGALSAEQLELFLHIQYMNGKLTYLDTPELRNNVIINPICLIDVLKSIVTAVPSVPELSKGRLLKSSLESLLTSKQFSQIRIYKDYFRKLLVYYDVLAEIMRYDVTSGKRLETDEFVVPCMVTTNFEPSLVTELLPLGKYISFVFVFRGSFVPAALPKRLIASILSIWNVSLHKNKELMFSNFIAVKVDRKHDLAIQVQHNFITVYLIHKKKMELIIRDVASSVRECLEENMNRISEVYSFSLNENMKPQRSVPFDLKLRSRCCLRDPKELYSLKDELECSAHGKTTPVSELRIWYTDRTAVQCPPDCQGVPDVVHSMLLSDTQLLRLCNSLTRKEVRSIALYLGIQYNRLEQIDMEQESMKSMRSFYTFRACREKNKRCKDFLKSMESAKIYIHTMCQILREEEVSTELPDKILIAVPSDEMLDKLSIRIGKEWMILGIELGLSIERLEQIEYENPRDLRETSRRMLYVWRNSQDLGTIRELAHALGRAGRNPDLIREILENCVSFPKIEPID